MSQRGKERRYIIYYTDYILHSYDPTAYVIGVNEVVLFFRVNNLWYQY